MKYLAFRTFLARQQRAMSPTERAGANYLRLRPLKLHQFVDDLHADFQGEASGPVTDFLEWLLGRAPEILALLREVMDLFQGDE